MMQFANNISKVPTSAQKSNSLNPRKLNPSARAGLIFPIHQVHRALKEKLGGKKVRPSAAVQCAAALEYIAAEVLELSGTVCKELNKKSITPRHIQLGIRGDEELDNMHKGATIAGGGVLPKIHKALQQKEKPKSIPRSRASSINVSGKATTPNRMAGSPAVSNPNNKRPKSKTSGGA
ncbi:core histone h2A/H2B/H3/H4 domain-containing protein [Ditylenchus destructor]|uniref:Histone H2A n=1 Tax=Ditylenchus destructor TaxID=166010 RepID=A0AAD4N870_9BILA|nr:core histone h2A/H2B/H3/H4 domain-containing protein [Ditylenchus destructor]